MAIFRKIHTSIWSDSFFSELDSEQKLFYLYLLTNERTKQCGVYEITKRQIAFDLSYSIDKVSILLKYFTDNGKIKYNDETKEIGIANWLKFNSSTSPKVVSCINKEFADVKDTLLIQYVRSIGTLSQQEQEQEQEQEKILYSKKEFLKDWNELRTKHFKKPSFLNTLYPDDELLLKDLLKGNTKEDVRNAMIGLFKQKKMPNGQTTMQSNPSHFLKFFNSYLTAYHDKNDNLYGKPE